ncbi:hypothetical protein C9F11_20165 [Streptomyces sp. YIM 121038]|uniref:hypothetical protein n=1 Tax=Streptomyces sp. YIM 121038 TaxID=2136401 RepID=UPI0011105CA2|nr:hypothetical protein [Streptomyces sp. YIM 121038]QCX77668.1 hypothetical protein C9F11_20165 [Streptomyces sp. YIM 121038]
MGRVYATPAQLTAWTGKPAPADAERLLARASEDIDDTLARAVYLTDDAGMPTDPAIAAALRDAVCAQVEYQLATGDDGTGAAGRWDSVSIGPVALSGRKDGPQAPDDVDLGPRAHRTLKRAGLLPGVIW